MDMKSYERGKLHLVVFPSIPQWAIVDEQGHELLLHMVISGLSVQDITALYPGIDPAEIAAKCHELESLYNPTDDAQEVQGVLTDRTTVAMIAVTRRCNLRCDHCYVDATGMRGKELTVMEHSGIAQQLHTELAGNPAARYRVNLTGGEPFVHSDIMEIIDAYLNVGFEVAMSTNGLLITDDKVASLAQLGVTVSVSLDGPDAATHDAIRGVGHFAQTVERIKAMVDGGMRVGLNHLVHTGNFPQLEEVVSLAHHLGCTGFNPINLVQLGRACSSKLSRACETELFKHLASYLVKHPEQLYLFERTSQFSSLGAAILSGVTCASCGVGSRPCVYIAPEGDVYPCANTQKPEFLLGNMRNETLSLILRQDHPVLAQLRGLRVDTLNSKCATCDVRCFCGGDCRGETFNVTGDIRAPYVACDDRHDSIVELMWIVAEHPELFEQRANEFIGNASRGI